jgi:putative addiction module CopG family antidote
MNTAREAAMNIILKPELQRFIDDQVQSGRFSSPSEVLEAGIARLMLDPLPDELDADDLAAIEQSERQIAAGQDLDWKEVSAELRRKYLDE